MNSIKLVSAAVATLIILASSGCWARRGEVKERWVADGKNFSISVTAHEERGGVPLSGRFYVLQSSAAGAGNWQEVMTVFTKDPVPIPRENARYVNDRIAYFYMKQKYAVTVDGGLSWSVFDAGKAYDNYAFIKDVRIEADGEGVITFHDVPSQDRKVPELYTADYGQHWGEKPDFR